MVVDVVVVALLAIVVALLVIEHVRPVRNFERVPNWRLKCVAFLIVFGTISTVTPYAFAELIADVKLLPGHELGVVGGVAVGILVSELAMYWVHWADHKVSLLWRLHQMHHSAERVDVWGAGLMHPLEVFIESVLGLVFFNVILGLAPEAAALSGLWQLFNAVFQHANIRTPTWLGYFIQRPEAHCIHHQRGVHDFNYANLSLWDIVFGTFRNPPAWSGEVGFYSGASRKTVPMLVGRDISRGAA